MCGIIGVASGEPVAERAWLAAGCDAMRHRGPDDAGNWWSPDGRVGLGHRRLAIVDLSPGGHQPMQDIAGELCIVFNGEIYNFLDLRRELSARGHAFRSATDTEVIVSAYREWGADCVARLNGMFAFALYDSRARSVLLARDRAGEKPLYYSLTAGRLRFASELKGLMADPTMARRIDPEALDCYLNTGFVAGERSMIAGVAKLPPAHALRFHLDSGECQRWRYWRLPEPNAAAALDRVDETSLLDELEALLEDSVRRQLVADVPVGVLLSGGVDSSIVTAMAVRTTPRTKTFTIRFPGHGRFDETEHARLIARHFGTEHIELNAGESTVSLMPMLARQFDEPMADSSMIPTYLVSQLVRQHCTVVLGGDGGDELFGGYIHYNRWLGMQRRIGGTPRVLRRAAARLGEALLPVGLAGRKWLIESGVSFDKDLPMVSASRFTPALRRRLLASDAGGGAAAESWYKRRTPRLKDPLQRITRMDFENYLPEDILVKVDRVSMLNSLEVRAPLLDHRIVEFAYRKVPSRLKASADTRKVLLKKLTQRLLPRDFDQHRKQGFVVPLDAWLRTQPWADFIRDTLLGPSSTFFDRKTVSELLRGQQLGLANGERLFSLLLFELWRREYRVTN